MCHTLVVETELAEVAELVLACVRQRHFVVARLREQTWVGVHEAVEVALKEEVLTSQRSLDTLVFLIFRTSQYVERVVLSESLLICTNDLRSEL